MGFFSSSTQIKLLYTQIVIIIRLPVYPIPSLVYKHFRFSHVCQLISC